MGISDLENHFSFLSLSSQSLIKTRHFPIHFLVFRSNILLIISDYINLINTWDSIFHSQTFRLAYALDCNLPLEINYNQIYIL